MSRRGHIRLLLLATAVWVGFWIAGLPSYFQQYSTATMVWFDGLLLLPIAAVVWLVLRRVPTRRRRTVALWMAFYFTVPLAVYDWLYCGIYVGHGYGFLWRFWYLTVYYAIPWVLMPCIAWALDRIDDGSNERSAAA